MKKLLFEQMGGTYTQVGDYLLPNLTFPEEKQKPIGVWGQRHLRYIKQHKRIFYTNLLTSCKLNGYLADINEQVENMFYRLVKQMAEKQCITETLKVENQMLWVQRTNGIQAIARDIIN